MNHPYWVRLLPTTLLLLLALAGCTSAPKNLGTDQPVMAAETLEMPTRTGPLVPSRVPTATEVPTPEPPGVDLPHPIPAAGLGNLVGQVRWNENGAADIDLKICTEFSWFGGCKGTIHTTTSDAEGIYVFQDIQPGQYALTLRVFDTDKWLYMTTGLMSERMYNVKGGETTEVGISDIYKVDLRSSQPAEKAIVAEARPIFTWDEYAEAGSYKIWINPGHGESVAIYEDVNTNEYTPASDLFNCEYTWKVEAYNNNAIKIAEVDDYRNFTVSGASYNCTIKIIKPLNNASVPASGIELEWEAHPLADYYKLFMWPENDSSTHTLDFLVVHGTTYTITDTLAPGKYILSVYVYDTAARQIAGSDISYVIVK